MRRLVRMLAADLRRALGLKFLLASTLIPVLIIMDNFSDFQRHLPDRSGSVWYFYFQSVSFGGVYGRYLLAMTCALPYAAAFLVEHEEQILPSVISRAGARSYFASKFAVSAFAGGLVNLLGQLILFLGLAAVFPLFDSNDLMYLDGSAYYGLMVGRPALYYGVALYFAFLNGALFSGLATWASSFLKSRYTVLAVPAIALFVIIQINRVLQLPIDWQLNQLMVMRVVLKDELTTIAVSTAATAAILAGCAFMFSRRGKKVIGLA